MFIGTVVTKVDEQKHLGFILVSGFSFRKHLNENIKRMLEYLNTSQSLYPSRHLIKCNETVAPILIIVTIYHTPPYQNQGPSGIPLNSLMEKVKGIQYQAALAISGAWSGSSHSKLYEELGWETLSDRCMCRRILQIQKNS